MSESQTFNMDCLEYMKTVPDKFFDLAVSDPPYGGGGADNQYKGAVVGRFGGRFEKYHLGDASSQIGNDSDIRHWDFAPPQEYFDELSRVSKNQIIWGGNYFSLPPTRCFLVGVS